MCLLFVRQPATELEYMGFRKLIPTTAKLQIYKAAIMPYFNYCSLVWHFCKGSDKNKLERTNERGLRAINEG